MDEAMWVLDHPTHKNCIRCVKERLNRTVRFCGRTLNMIDSVIVRKAKVLLAAHDDDETDSVIVRKARVLVSMYDDWGYQR